MRSSAQVAEGSAATNQTQKMQRLNCLHFRIRNPMKRNEIIELMRKAGCNMKNLVGMAAMQGNSLMQLAKTDIMFLNSSKTYNQSSKFMTLSCTRKTQ